MASTSAQNMINIATIAEDQMAIDKANGTFDANNAIDKYYGWQSGFTLKPAGMDGDPEMFAARLRDAFPMANNLRMAFNEHCFDAQGALNPEYARFLVAAAAEGFAFTFVYAGGDAQQYGGAPGLTGTAQANDIYAALSGRIHDGMVEGWDKMMDWLDANPSVSDAVYGLEVVNEPATYRRGEEASGTDTASRFVELYARHMGEIAQDLMARHADAKILVEGWGYSGTFDELASGNVGGRTALEHIRAVVGADLVWSAHLYPGWAGIGGELTAEETRAKLEDLYRVLGNDSILITETNASGGSVDNVAEADGDVFSFVRHAYEWFGERGIGVGWFPAVEFGGSNFVVIDRGGALRYLHQSSLAHGMNAFSIDEADPAHAASEAITSTLVRGRVRNEGWEPGGSTFDDTDGMGFAFGHDGNDTVTGQDRANDLLFGGRGNDALYGLGSDDHLFGQAGSDRLFGGVGRDFLFGGDGNDTLDGGGGGDQLTGGRGADRFVVGAGRVEVADFRSSEGDTVILDGQALTVIQLAALGVRANVQGAALANDLVVARPSGDVVFVNFFALNAVALFGPRAVEVNGTLGNDRIDSTFRDGEGNMVGEGNDTVRAEGGNDTVTGGNGHDRIWGHGGDDSLIGGAGNDVMYGGLGNDTLSGWEGDDVLFGDQGSDLLYGNGGNDRLVLGTMSGRAYGGDGNDTLEASLAKGADPELWGGAGADRFVVTGGASAKSSVVVVGDFERGVDTLTLDGKTAASWYADNRAFVTFVQDGGDVRVYWAPTQSLVLRGESMADALALFGAPTTAVRMRTSEDALSSGLTHDADQRNGTDGADVLRAGGGDDGLSGGKGSDLLFGGSGNDTLSGGSGNDTLYGGSGNDVLYGSSAGNMLYGDAGNDVIASGSHSSLLFGGDGNDTLKTSAFKSAAHSVSGGAGADLFVFERLAAGDGNSRTTITDFQVGVDRFMRAGVAEGDALDKAVVSQVGAHTLVVFDTGDNVLLQNVNAVAFEAFYG